MSASDLIDPAVLARARAIRDSRDDTAHGQNFASHVDRRTTATLTERRLEVLELLAEGLTNSDIADELAISKQTVQSHVAKVLAILGARNRTHAVAIALRTAQLPTRPVDSETSSETPATQRKDGTMPSQIIEALVKLLESLANLVDAATKLVEKESGE